MLKNGVKGLFLSELTQNASVTRRIAYVAVMAALSALTNQIFEFLKLTDNQLSLTIMVSIFIGIVLGSGFGFVSCVIGDLVGFLLNSGGMMFMPWVGLSTGMFAFIAGFIVNGFDFKVKGQIYIKLALVTLFSFLICTVGINSTGFYFYNQAMGFSTAVMNYVAENFGGEVTFFAYLMYRLIFKLQILNSVVNYVLCFAFIPLLLKIKIFNPNHK